MLKTEAVGQVPREMLKTEAVGRGFHHLPRDLANVNVLENNVWSLLLHKVNDLLFVKVWETIWHYILLPVGRQRASAHFFKYPSSRSERIKRFKMAVIIRFDLDISKMTVQGGCCSTVVVQNDIQIHQQKPRKAYPYIDLCNNFYDERA